MMSAKLGAFLIAWFVVHLAVPATRDIREGLESYWHRRSPEHIQEVIDKFQDLVDNDPGIHANTIEIHTSILEHWQNRKEKYLR